MKLMIKKCLKNFLLTVLVFSCILNLTSCKERKFEDKTKGMYENYIMAAQNYYEKNFGKKGTFRYGNVIAEFVNTRDEMAQTNSDAYIVTLVVMLVYEENDKFITKNFLCQVPKGKFERIVKKWTAKQTSYIKDAVKAADSVNKDRLKTGSIELDVKTGEIEIAKAVKVGAFGLKTDIGKIYDALGDTAIGAAAGIEETLNTIGNKKIKDSEIVEKMTDAAYYYAIGYFSRHIYEEKGIDVNPISVNELKRTYLDKDEVKMYDKLISDNHWESIEGTNDENNEIDDRTKYEKYLEENGIEKNDKDGYSNNTIKFFSNYKIEIPSYFKPFAIEDNVIGYTANLKNNNNAILVVIDDTVDMSEYSIDGDSEIDSIANALVNLMGGKEKFEIDGSYKSVANDEIKANLFALMSNKFYSEVVKFYDDVDNKNIYVMLLEYLDGKIEYKNDFENIYENIAKIKHNISIESSKDIMDGNFNGNTEPIIANVEEYFREKGFVNIKKKPEFDIGDGILGNITKKFAGGFYGKKVDKDYVFEILINGNDFDGTQRYKEDDEVVIHYHDYKKNKDEYYENEDDIIFVDTPDLSDGKKDKDEKKDEEEDNTDDEKIDEITSDDEIEEKNDEPETKKPFDKENKSEFSTDERIILSKVIGFYEDGDDAPEYKKIELEYYKEYEEELTDGLAYLILGYTYQNGDADISEDIDTAIKYFEKAAELGNSEALVAIGSIYEDNREDYESAKDMYEKAIKLGNSDAMYNLANMYENGRGIEKNYEKAIEFYEKAGEKDDSASLYRIGLFYEKGMGVEENIDKAIEYYEKSAKLNNKKAKEALEKLKNEN